MKLSRIIATSTLALSLAAPALAQPSLSRVYTLYMHVTDADGNTATRRIKSEPTMKLCMQDAQATMCPNDAPCLHDATATIDLSCTPGIESIPDYVAN